MAGRGDMGSALALDPSSPTKTFVLEVHTEDSAGYLSDMVGSTALEVTDDAYLFRARVGEHVFWVDQLDDRFWSFHTDMPVREASAFLRDQIERRRDLDWMWLPSGHLRNAWPDSTSRQVRTRFQGERFLPLTPRSATFGSNCPGAGPSSCWTSSRPIRSTARLSPLTACKPPSRSTTLA